MCRPVHCVYCGTRFVWGGIFLSSRSFRSRKSSQFLCQIFAWDFMQLKKFVPIFVVFFFFIRKSGTWFSWFSAGSNKILQLVGETSGEQVHQKSGSITWFQFDVNSLRSRLGRKKGGKLSDFKYGICSAEFEVLREEYVAEILGTG